GELLARMPTHQAVGLLTPFVNSRDGPSRATWEDTFPRFCAKYGLPRPLMNVPLLGYIVDALFPEEKLIVELDSWEFHQTRIDFENDRERDAQTLAASYATVRITWERLRQAPAPEAERLHIILEQRRRRSTA